MSMNWSIATFLISILSTTLTGTLDREMPITPLDSHNLPKEAAVVMEDIIYLLENHESALISKYYDAKNHETQVGKSGMSEEQYRVEILGLWVLRDDWNYYESGNSDILNDVKTVTVLYWDQDKAGNIHVSAGVSMASGASKKVTISLMKSGKVWLLLGAVG